MHNESNDCEGRDDRRLCLTQYATAVAKINLKHDVHENQEVVVKYFLWPRHHRSIVHVVELRILDTQHQEEVVESIRHVNYCVTELRVLPIDEYCLFVTTHTIKHERYG